VVIRGSRCESRRLFIGFWALAKIILVVRRGSDIQTNERWDMENRRFNEELQRQIDGTLPVGHIYKIGLPGDVLLASGIPNLPIEMNAATLARKASESYHNNHPFDLAEIKGFPKAIQNPIMVFDSRTRADSKVILTELKSGGANIVVALKMNHKKGSNRSGIVEVNSIRSIYPKGNVKDIASWYTDGLLRYADKEKASAFLEELRLVLSQKSSANAEATAHTLRGSDLATHAQESLGHNVRND